MLVLLVILFTKLKKFTDDSLQPPYYTWLNYRWIYANFEQDLLPHNNFLLPTNNLYYYLAILLQHAISL